MIVGITGPSGYMTANIMLFGISLTWPNCFLRHAFVLLFSADAHLRKAAWSCKTNLQLGSIHVVSIDVPWGRISGKAWGSPSGRPVLSLHGMDQLIN